MLAIVVSRADEASERIGDQLLELADWDERVDERRSDASGGGTYYQMDGAELRTFDDLHLNLDGAAGAFDDPNLLVFASQHAGDSGSLLTAHATGNFGPAEYGGRKGSLARSAPNALSAVRAALDRHAPPAYDTGIECTHHGPSTVGCPSLFVELGSAEPQWRDDEAAEALARAILELREVPAHRERTVVGFGGGHYAPRYDRIMTETDWAVGHVAADWSLEAMGDPHESRAVVAKAFQMSGTEFAHVDGSYPGLEDVVEELGFETLSETFLRETTGVPLDIVGRLETALVPVDEGLRFGSAAEEYDGEFVREELSEELLDEANGVDHEAVIDALERVVLAYETTEGGTRAAGPIALTDVTEYRSIVEALAGILETKYETVEVREAEILACREAFDPALAREAGVELGPDFGRLSAGESVELDGRVVEPADVWTAREQRFPL